MKIGFTRLGRVVLWLVVSVLVTLSILVTTLRIALPQLNQFQPEIKAWVKQHSGFDFSIANVSGTWRNNHPSISLQGLKANLPKNPDVYFAVEEISIEFDLLQSLVKLQPVVADMTMQSLQLDLKSLDLLGSQDGADAESPSSEQDASDADKATSRPLIAQLDNLLLRQLDDFSLRDGQIWYRSVSGDVRQLEIATLRWQNQQQRHFAEGVVSIVDADINALSVSANFVDHGSLRDISGDFYLNAAQISLTPWLTAKQLTDTGIESGQVSLRAWLTLERSRPESAFVDLLPSQLVWQDETLHVLRLASGRLKLQPDANGLKVSGRSLQLYTDEQPWPALDLALEKPHQGPWTLNLSQLSLEALAPLAKLVPDSQGLNEALTGLSPRGALQDVRVSMASDIDSLRYSAQLADFALDDWSLLPGFEHLQGQISGHGKAGKAQLRLVDEQVPYSEVFQAPLNIKLVNADLLWQYEHNSWQLWSDKLQVATPDLQAIGSFRLDFPEQASPFLSFYVEADAFNAGATWRYLPVPALGDELTDYLSSAIQGGRAETAKLLWYGDVGQFPYDNHDGMFQALVGLEQGKFSFDTAWPTITELQLDLLFQNEAMFLDSKSARLGGVRVQRITGRIPDLAEDGHIEIEARASGTGSAVRDYMMATPLVDSVGAALTALQVDGQVTSAFNLHIPFDVEIDPRAWGYADLKRNQVVVDAPPMTLSEVTGRIRFDNDVVTGSDLQATLLEQPMVLGFNGRSAGDDYHVAINARGDWALQPLAPYVGEHWVNPLSGHAPWAMDVDLQLDDVGFTYQLDLNADLLNVASRYPYPLSKGIGSGGSARLQASGNQESITARLLLPQAKYQTEIDIRPEVPVLLASNLVLGSGAFKPSPISGHQAEIRTQHVDLGAWLSVIDVPESEHVSGESGEASHFPEIPLPTKVTLDTDVLLLEGVEWNDVQFSAEQHDHNWKMAIDSQQVSGQATYLAPYDLAVSLSRLHLHLPQLDDEDLSHQTLTKLDDEPKISDADRQLFAQMPNLTLNIEDFWVQGYKVGQANLVLERQDDSLKWKTLKLSSGSNTLELTGQWSLSGDRSKTAMTLDFSGKNNSDLMERFGITSGIQKAPFDIQGKFTWQGSPWSMQVNTLNGDMNTEFGKGVITDISGAAKLLGLFSLDSIIRKMQLDFTDVFDQGMAFDSITGSGQVRDGVFFTHDIVMDALAGEMRIQGLADLNSRLVDAKVQFSPDITSGIPMLTAFAVAPHTALYVLAISTVIAPVVEVFTQVNYEVKGPLDSPTVNEISRSRSEFELPDTMRKGAE